jgi:hypothetical protein
MKTETPGKDKKNGPALLVSTMGVSCLAPAALVMIIPIPAILLELL